MEFETMKKDTPTNEYFQFPKFILCVDGLSMNGKVVYSLVYNRIQQSSKNEFFNELDGSSFCYFSNEELENLLGLSKATVKRTITELKEKGLLKREKDGSNRSKIFLKVPVRGLKYDPTDGSNMNPSGLKYDPTDGSNMNPSGLKYDPTDGSNMNHPFPYIRKTIKEDNKKDNTREETKPEEPPKPKKSSKAQEATKEIIEHWNKNYQTKYSSESKGTIKLVESILKSGYQLDQILQVIDYKAKARRTEADYKWFVPATVLALKNFERNYQFMINDQAKPTQNGIRTNYGSQPNQGYKNKNKIPESVTLPEWYEVKESEQANESDVKKILELQNSILKGV